MSDRMTNTEVEDVLASIRRLVSDDHRAEAPQAKATASDRLVLTPALRVMDNSRSDDVTDTAEPMADEAPVEQAQNDASDDVVDSAETDETMASGDLPPVTEPIVEDQARDPIALESVDFETETLMSIQDAFSNAEDAASQDQSGRQEPTADGDVDTDWDASNDAVETASEATSHEAETLSAKIAALETLIAGRSEEFDPDMPGDGAYAGTEAPTLAWEDAEDVADTEASAEPVEPELDDQQIFSSDEDVLDEEALRDLVSDIVREELQGALGERITRNVRKLVRREIHRALAAQDLE